jgi:elongation factor Ts
MDQIRKLREKTGVPVVRAKKVLEEVKGNEEKAEKILKKEGFEKAAKRSDRATDQGIIATYTHHNQKVVAMVELFSETDFVARNDLFKELAHNLALQLASMKAENAKELEEQDYIKDPSKKISELVKEVMAKTGENIRIGRVIRVELGK